MYENSFSVVLASTIYAKTKNRTCKHDITMIKYSKTAIKSFLSHITFLLIISDTIFANFRLSDDLIDSFDPFPLISQILLIVRKAV